MSDQPDKSMWERWCQNSGWDQESAQASAARRYFALHWEEALVPDDTKLMAEQLTALREMVTRLAQEVTAMQRVLRDHNLLDNYEQEMLRTMSHDHGGAGAEPWTRYTTYRLLLPESEYLEETLRCSEEDRQAFAANIEAQMRLT